MVLWMVRLAVNFVVKYDEEQLLLAIDTEVDELILTNQIYDVVLQEDYDDKRK